MEAGARNFEGVLIMAVLTNHEFLSLVEKMREAQKNYFQHRSTHYLELSKALEKQVDAHIKEISDPQLSLFKR
jgi:cell division protein ZapA (FtsZ GTPase activity inhibitor)